MTPTDVVIPSEVFNFSGQTTIHTWNLRERFKVEGLSKYDDWLMDELILSMQKIKELADEFPFWQRKNTTGRPLMEERDLLIAFLLKQFFVTTFRKVIGIMKLLNDYFDFSRIPKQSTLSKYNRTRRWSRIWKRFFEFTLTKLPKREVFPITDSTGYSGRKIHWRDVDYGLRCVQDWVKAHVMIEAKNFIILSYSLTDSDVHESQEFIKNWKNLPNNVKPKRSLADAAYTSNEILQAVRDSGAIPYHGLKKNAVYPSKPTTAYEKLVNFSKHWTNRFQDLYGMRNLIEAFFFMIDSSFGYRLRCRSTIGRRNEVHSKFSAHNIRMLAAMNFLQLN